MAVGDRSNEIMDLFEQIYELDKRAQEEKLGEVASSDPALSDAVRKLINSKREADAQGFLDDSNPGVTLTSSPAIGQQIGSFEIEGVLASGGMGTVYRARHVHLDRPIALKVPHMLHPNRDHLAERLRREGKALAKLDHPNIVRVYDAGVSDDGMPYIAMGLLEGKSLSTAWSKGQLDEDDIIKWGIQLAEALDYLHQQEIYHRDIKSSNIILNESGNAILADFGIAHVGDMSRITQVLPGTPAYMCPEQLRGRAIDGRCDIYSLGLVLFELLAGKPADGLSLKVHRPDVSERFIRIIEKCTEHNPAHRYQTGNDLARALRFKQPTPAQHTQNWQPAKLLGVLAVFVLLASVIYFLRPTPSPTQAIPVTAPPTLIESIIASASSEADLTETLSELRLEGTLSFGREDQFINPSKCHIFVFEDASRPPIIILSPVDPGTDKRQNLLNGEVVQDVAQLLENKETLWMQITP